MTLSGAPNASDASPPVARGFPPDLAPLVDREEERALAQSALSNGGFRLLTLTGPPGIGKTRLAAAVAADCEATLPDGVWFVDLSRITDAESVPRAILKVLGAPRHPAHLAREQLDRRLQDRRMMLVLDTFEHVLPAAVLVSELITTHGELTILVTSRQPLRLKWEHVLAVPPLRTAPFPSELSLEEIEALPSVQLFMQRAQARRIDLELSPEEVVDVAAICAQVEGSPLAVELAAGWVNVLPPSAILKYLTNHLDFLRSPARDAPERQQSLTAALDWSVSLLGEREQALLRCVSVFADTFTLDAAAALMRSGDEELLDSLGALVDTSLLVPMGLGTSETRFRLSNTVKAYAWQQLALRGEMDGTRERHAEYMLALAEREGSGIRQIGVFLTSAAGRERKGPSISALLEALDREHANMVAALRWFRQSGGAEKELRLAAALSSYWWTHGHLAEGIQWLQDGLSENLDADPALRLQALNGLALLLRLMGQAEGARDRLDEALSLARSQRDPRVLGETLVNGAAAQLDRDAPSLSTAQDLLQEAVSVFSETGDAWGEAAAHLYLAVAALFGGRGRRAEELLEAAQAEVAGLDELRTHGALLLLTGHAAGLQGNAERARTSIAQSVRLWSDIPEPQRLAEATSLFAWLLRNDQPRQSAVLLGAADSIVDRGYGRTAYHRFLRAEAMERLTDALTENELESALESGHAWSLEDLPVTLLAMLDGDGGPLLEDESDTDPAPEPELTQRELEILQLMSEGLSTHEIAQTVFVSSGTVKLDIRSIFSKLNVDTRAQAMKVAVERDLI